MAMAPVRQWSNLPTDILQVLAKILNTDVDILRLRSVCSSWRSSVSRRLRPSVFPLMLPSFTSDSTSGNIFLNYTTLYRLSPPLIYGPHTADPSDGWLFRVLEVNPNRFSLLAPLNPNKVEFPPGTIPKSLSLLDYRISEVCRCYSLNLCDGKGYALKSPNKVIVLWDYALGFEFVVLALQSEWCMSYWKFGDTRWTPIDTKDHDVSDAVVIKGKCYAISRRGVLLSFDSKFNLTAVHFPHVPVDLPVDCAENDNFLVEYKSDLYVISKILEYPDNDDQDDTNKIPLRLEIFKKCNDNWKNIRCLGDEMFLYSDDVSVGLSAKDLRILKSNCVYLAHTDVAYSFTYGEGILYGVYDMDKGGRGSTTQKMALDHTLRYWLPPAWLISS